ncbi:transcriptional regulator Kaiso isoform X2 [Orussus abietinus]|uniref:transcriptional regulator Kaiso isoform X2 n=1 Tax=Orussus abietinus TaxID=222816 RepID=UPI00062522F6|nr:transcriptional regulator Kaiso isoform X2 [Orussus abietinus]
MGSSSQLYSLSWGDFGTSLVSAVQLLRGHGDLVDVTLAAGGRTFSAHKIVLSAASPFLLDLLKSTPCQHPVVMLAGIGAEDLESLLEFVYRGEVSVEPSQLPSLLQAAHCLSIHGLTPPTIVTDNGEEVPLSNIPVAGESTAKDTLGSFSPLRRKKRRKSSSSSGKRSRVDSNVDIKMRNSSEFSEDSETVQYDRKEDDISNTGDAVSDRLECTSLRSLQTSPTQLLPIPPENSHPLPNQDQISDTEPHLHTLLPMQPYSPLHIPSFPGSLNIGYPNLALSIGSGQCSLPGSTPSALVHGAAGSSKIRGASDCPGVCPLCGATLRQARNLRRHLLSSCKYRFSTTLTQQSESMMIEIKPEVEIPGYTIHPSKFETDTAGSNSCEKIICNPSPLPSPSPHGSCVVSPQSNASSPNVTS